jgi:hypothetical protein
MVKKTEENVIQRIFLRNTVTVMCAVRKWLWNAGRWAPVSTKVNGETRERLGQSAKRSAAVRGQAGRGATVAGRRLRRAAEQNAGIFCLPGFVADRWRMCFLRGSLPRFFLRVRDPRKIVSKILPSRVNLRDRVKKNTTLAMCLHQRALPSFHFFHLPMLLGGCEREREREREREGGGKQDRRKFGEAQNRIDNEECG